MADEASYTIVAIGSGFACTFFLERYLRTADPGAKVLVLERGPRMSREEQIDRLPEEPLAGASLIERRGALDKTWRFSVGFGGGSNCWWGCTPRMLPSDFEMRTRYGVGEDWPISYDTLESYYCEAEEMMSISGPATPPYPMSRPYPLPPHRFSDVDRLMQGHFGAAYVQQPTARASRATALRNECCAGAVCSLCPVNAKFTIENDMAHVYDDPRVTLMTQAEAVEVLTRGDVAEGVRYRKDGAEVAVAAEIVLLGANAIFNATLLLRSGFADHSLGRYLSEQCGVEAHVNLAGVKNFAGSTVMTGSGFMFYDGPHRAEHAGCLVEGWNRVKPRLDYGRWAETVSFRLIYEDLPQATNRVTLPDDGSDWPVVTYDARSAYLEAGLASAPRTFEELLAPLPVESYRILDPTTNEAHILGTARMGEDPETSVVDADLVHHRVRNLLVLGGSSFVTCAPANPTLTLSALSLRAADRLSRSQA